MFELSELVGVLDTDIYAMQTLYLDTLTHDFAKVAGNRRITELYARRGAKLDYTGSESFR